MPTIIHRLVYGHDAHVDAVSFGSSRMADRHRLGDLHIGEPTSAVVSSGSLQSKATSSITRMPQGPERRPPYRSTKHLSVKPHRAACRPIPISHWLLALGVQEPKTGREGRLIRRRRRRSRCISGSRRRTEPFRLLLLRWRPLRR